MRLFLETETRSYAVAFLTALIITLASHQTASTREPRVRERFAIEPQCEVLTLPISIYGKTYPFIVNTGATRTIFYAVARPLLGPAHGTHEVFTAAGTLQYGKYEPPPMWLGKLPFAPRSGGYLDDKTVCPYQTYGQLGMDVFSNQRATIDFDEGKVSVLDRDGEPAGKPIQISRLANLPVIKADVAGEEVDFIIATGATGNGSGSLSEEVFDRLESSGRLAVLGDSSITSDNQDRRALLGRVRKLSIVGDDVRDALFYRARLNILGLSFLSRYTVTFDFPNNTLYLRQGENFSRRDSMDMSGLVLSAASGVAVVTSVAARSPAEKSGITAGDVLVSVDGITVSNARLYEIRRGFHAQGKRFRLMTRRNDEVFGREFVTQTEIDLIKRSAAREAEQRRRAESRSTPK